MDSARFLLIGFLALLSEAHAQGWHPFHATDVPDGCSQVAISRDDQHIRSIHSTAGFLDVTLGMIEQGDPLFFLRSRSLTTGEETWYGSPLTADTIRAIIRFAEHADGLYAVEYCRGTSSPHVFADILRFDDDLNVISRLRLQDTFDFAFSNLFTIDVFGQPVIMDCEGITTPRCHLRKYSSDGHLVARMDTSVILTGRTDVYTHPDGSFTLFADFHGARIELNEDLQVSSTSDFGLNGAPGMTTGESRHHQADLFMAGGTVSARPIWPATGPDRMAEFVGIWRRDSFQVVRRDTIQEVENFLKGFRSFDARGDRIFLSNPLAYDCFLWLYQECPNLVTARAVDTLGNLLWFRLLGGDANYHPTGLVATADGGCIILAYRYEHGFNGPEEHDVCAIKLDSTGTIEPDFFRGLTAVRRPDPGGVDVLVSPNPTAGRVTIRARGLPADLACRVIDASGRVVREAAVENGTLSLDDLPAGTYRLHLSDGGDLKVVETVVVR